MLYVHFYANDNLIAVKVVNFPFRPSRIALVKQWATEGRLGVEKFDRVEVLERSNQVSVDSVNTKD
jgi:hypothetical protein